MDVVGVSKGIQDNSITSNAIIDQDSEDSESGGAEIVTGCATTDSRILRPKRGLPDNIRYPQDSDIQDVTAF